MRIIEGFLHDGNQSISLVDLVAIPAGLFLLFWILAASSQEQKQEVSEYFRTPIVIATEANSSLSVALGATGTRTNKNFRF